jgi:hypothetical protein
MTTAQPMNLDPSTRNLISAVTQDLMSSNLMWSQGVSASRDVGPDLSGTSTVSGTPTTAGDQDAQRLFGSILSGIVQNVLPKVATGIIGMLQQKRRELGLPEQRDAASVERDLQSILSSLLPKLIEAVPMIASSLSGKPAPRSTEEESQRFLPFLAALIPAVISAAPGIISAFNRRRGVDGVEPSISNPEVAERFIGPLLQTLVPQLLQSAPSILGSIFGGGRRDVQAAVW